MNIKEVIDLVFNNCLMWGHLYRPVEEQGYVVQKNGKSRRGARYTCECCGKKTKWMTVAEKKVFQISECPTWGDRGSDSQGYRRKNNLEKILDKEYD